MLYTVWSTKEKILGEWWQIKIKLLETGHYTFWKCFIQGAPCKKQYHCFFHGEPKIKKENRLLHIHFGWIVTNQKKNN